MDKSKFRVGQTYQIHPTPKYRNNSKDAADLIVVRDIKKDLLSIEHLSTKIKGDLFFDSIHDFRDPCYLMLKAQLWIDSGILSVDPLPDPRLIQATARLFGMHVYYMPQPKTDNSEVEKEKALILKIIGGQQTAEAIRELKKILCISKSETNALQIILALVAWHTQPADKPSDGVSLCNDGIKIANQVNAMGHAAILHSYRAVFRTQQWTYADLNLSFTIKAGNKIGFHTITEEQRKKEVLRMEHMQTLVDQDLKDAIEITKKLDDPEFAGVVLSNRVITFGFEAMHRKQCGMDWEYQREALKKSFNAGKELLIKTGHSEALAYLYHNAANQLRGLNESDQALGLAEEARKIAAGLGNIALETVATKLIELIKEKPKTDQDSEL